MPASRSPSRGVEPRASRSYWPYIAVGAVALLVVVIAALPASLIVRFLPEQMHVDDLSGSLWHGSAGRVGINGRDVGALEWHLHPLSLLRLTLIADLHWVKAGFVIDGTADVDRQGVTAHDIQGHGPIEDLTDLGLPAGWMGTAVIDIADLRSDFNTVQSATGTITVADLTSARVAGGANLGGYQLSLPPDSVAADGSITAALHDTGGPIEAQAEIKYSPASHLALLTGTLKERPTAAVELRTQLQNLSQLRPRDGQGRIPFDMEFTL